MIRGLIGEKLSHSFSKSIHELIVDKPYDLYSLTKDEVHDLLVNKTFSAINVTIPYKEYVLDYLDEKDEAVKRIGACNCIVNRDGKLIGYNTDYDGFKYTLAKHNLNLNNQKILVIGSGGASKAIRACLEDEKVSETSYLTRSKNKDTLSYDEIDKTYDVDWIINTSPMGMYPNVDQLDIDLSKYFNLKGVIDIVYNPLNTRLMIAANKLNLIVIGGLEMLVAQAVRAVELFENKSFDQQLIDQLYHNIHQDKQNIVLLGMPFSGKSSVGKLLAEKLNRQLYDIDELIEKRIKMKIKDYFEINCEASFREIESNIIKEASILNNAIIVCGGGVVKDKSNYSYLKQNGYLIHIFRPLDKMVMDDQRPLSKTKEELHELWQTRSELYSYFEDKKIINDESIEVCIERILKDYGNNI